MIETAKQQMYYNYTEQHFPSEEGPGASAFYKDEAGKIYHTYSTFGRGLEGCISAYNYLDIAPKGRNEENLPHPMAWVRHHDRYQDNYYDAAPAGASASAAAAASGTAMKSGSSCCAGDHPFIRPVNHTDRTAQEKPQPHRNSEAGALLSDQTSAWRERTGIFCAPTVPRFFR
jgi:hypothetical protein